MKDYITEMKTIFTDISMKSLYEVGVHSAQTFNLDFDIYIYIYKEATGSALFEDRSL